MKTSAHAYALDKAWPELIIKLRPHHICLGLWQRVLLQYRVEKTDKLGANFSATERHGVASACSYREVQRQPLQEQLHQHTALLQRNHKTKSLNQLHQLYLDMLESSIACNFKIKAGFI
jgi:hypothetical protein